MTTILLNRTRKRAKRGFAIGPILFIIALIAVIGAALSSGSGGFNASSGEETAKVNASNVVSQATSLKFAVDRLITNGLTLPATGIVSQAANLALTPSTRIDFSRDCSGTGGSPDQGNCLYSPLGGGVSPQVPPSKAVPSATQTSATPWVYFMTPMEDIGTSAGEELVALLPVTQPVCAKIVQQIYGNSETVEAVSASPLTVSSGSVTAFSAPDTTDGARRLANCVSNGTDHVFYQVLSVQ